MRLGTRFILLGSVAMAAAVWLLAPAAAKAWRSLQAERHRARIAQAWESVKRGQDYLSFSPAEDDDLKDEERDPRLPEQDDPMMRGLVNAAEWGFPSQAAKAQVMLAARAEAAKEATRAHAFRAGAIRGSSLRTLAPLSPASAQWVSIGPTDVAKKEYNGDEYVANDTGRGQAIRVDPLDPNTLYFAVSGGGVWRTSNFGSATPDWTPLMDAVGNLSVGAMDLYPGATTSTHTLWVGLGDFTDAPSGLVVFSRDSGATWSLPIALSGRYNDGAGGHVDPQPETVATRIRDLRVDPNNPDVVMVATEVGLFRSTNGTSAAPTFALIDLPNPGTGTAALCKESAWSFAYLGIASAQGSASNWLLSGVQAVSNAVAYASLPPGAGGGSASTPGDVWKSTDGGATWTSLRAAGKITAATLGLAQEVGRIALAAGSPVAGDPTQTVVYGQAGNASEAAPVQLATLKTSNAGTAFTVVSKNTDAAGKLTNPTLNTNCNTMDVAHGQAWYNLAIAVDPANSNNVIQGGNLCGVRSIDGGTTWQNVSNWLPLPGFVALGSNQGNTSTNPVTMLPYVHADWHTLLVAGGQVLAGSDGGLFASGNAWDPTVSPTNMPVTWRSVNTGLVTHLLYSVASGDPVTGNHRFSFTGLQDNGTRFRDSGTSTKWNQVVGGDGIGTAISIWPDGSHQVFWQSLPGSSRRFCRPGEALFVPGSFDPAIAVDCNSGLLHPNQGPDNLITEFLTWNPAANTTLPSGDTEPFLVRYSPLGDAAGTLFTASTNYAWKLNIDDNDLAHYTLISKVKPANSFRGMYFVTPWTYNGTLGTRLYGIPLSGGSFWIGIENDPVSGTAWSWKQSASPPGSTGTTGVSQIMTSTSSIIFPHDPTHLGGSAADVSQTYIVSSVTPLDTTNQLIRDDVGRIFRTTNNGASWTSIATVASGMPNVPVNIVRFDPSDQTDNTLYAGTDIGVYVTYDQGAHWQRFGVGFPMVRVTDLFIASNGSLIRAATYGRGMWEIYPRSVAGTGTGDWDTNGQIDFFDLAAVAARMGQAPGVAALPYYDNAGDLGSHGAIDDTDLTTLLAKYGGQP
jgi:hypothetical protein